MILFFLLLKVNIDARILPDYLNRKLTVGDPFEMEIKVTAPPGLKISEPLLDSLGPFMVLDQKRDIIQEKGLATTTYRIRLAPFATGEIETPGFRFLIQDSNRVDSLMSPKSRLKVISVMKKEMADINDIKKPFGFPDYRPWIALGIAVIGAGLTYLGLKVFKRVRQRTVREEEQLPPWTEALLALDRIPLQEWLAEGQVKRYYYALSEILKRYIERRYDFAARDQTTTEIATNLKLRRVPLRDDFTRFFHNADFVKYAKFVPAPKEIEQALIQVRELVNHTIPTVETEVKR
ncbi:MAG: hypothetical protein ABIL05_03415 [candidate division WOR-3 bacterium]